MRIKRLHKSFFIFAILLVWGIVTYFLFLSKPHSYNNRLSSEHNVNKENDDIVAVRSKLGKLESDIRIQFELNSDLLRDLQEALETKKESFNAVAKSEISSEDKILKLKNKFKNGTLLPVLVFACNRVGVRRCLDQLIKYRPNENQFPIIVSQDCGDEATKEVIESYGDKVSLIQQPDLSDIQVPPKEKKFKGYFKIARHYGWALNQTFFKYNFDAVIIVEDDLDIAPDFYEYFLGTYPLLQRDQSLWCVSAWNDNGKVDLVNENGAEQLYRTDFFPGLGWMLTKEVWTELAVKWPKAYWDDWIRQPEQRKDRACIRPEVSRTKTFGKVGVSNGMFYEKHLKFIKLNEKFVPFSKLDLSYLMKNRYDVDFVKTVYQSTVISYQELKNGQISHNGAVRIPYHTKDAYKKTAKMLGLMDDFRSGVPRTGYRGIVTFYYRGRTVYLAPNVNWKGYDITWS